MSLNRIEEEEFKEPVTQMKHSIADRDVAPNVENWFSTNEQRKHNDMLDNEKIQVA